MDTDVKTHRPIWQIARDIQKAWRKDGVSNVYFGARPYLEAMLQLDGLSEMYGADDAKGIVLYFLANAQTFRGPEAKALKAELKAIIGAK